jgi:hypothetical protein
MKSGTNTIATTKLSTGSSTRSAREAGWVAERINEKLEGDKVEDQTAADGAAFDKVSLGVGHGNW